MAWVGFAMITVVCWGLYGAFLHKGAMGFENDRMKAFLFVGVAYFLIAVIGPLLVIVMTGKEPKFEFKPDGIKLSLFAGVLGAVGALTVLFALNSNPTKGPAAASQVMSLVFAGAPVVAAIFAVMTRKEDTPIDWRFFVGIVMAATGGAMVTYFKP
jgi:drug/metabolite transporter (DMT)-like permease